MACLILISFTLLFFFAMGHGYRDLGDLLTGLPSNLDHNRCFFLSLAAIYFLLYHVTLACAFVFGQLG